MHGVELYLLGFIVSVAGISIGWFIYDSRSEDEK